MATTEQETKLAATLNERFKQLPKVVQDAITSADVEQHLRTLADTNKLHIDQWQLLENEVMLTLLGFQEPEDLAENLKKDLEVSDELARSLAEDISRIVFEPIRAQLEQNLEVVGANAPQNSGDLTDSRTFEQASPQKTATPAVIPATPPPAPPEGKAVRAPISESYAAKQPSHERKVIEGDPYREQVL